MNSQSARNIFVPMVGVFSIVGILAVVNPSHALASNDAEATALAYCGKKPSPSCREFASLLHYLLKDGDLRPNDYADSLAPTLKLPANGAFAKADGVPEANPNDVARTCHLMFDKDPSEPGARPVCVVISISYPDAGSVVKESFFRFRLDGKPDIAVDSEGKIDEKGNPIKGSAIYHDLKLKKAEVKALVEKELAFWIKHAKDMSAKGTAVPQKDAVKDQPVETSATLQDQSK